MIYKLERWFLPALTFIVFILGWQILVNLEWYPKSLLPSPLMVGEGFVELTVSGKLFDYIGVSLLRLVLGFGLAALVAIPFGIVCALVRKIWIAVEPFIQLLRPISPIAWFPFIGLWMNTNLSPIFIIFLSAFFPILLSTFTSFRSVQEIHVKIASNFGLSEWNRIKKIILPSIFPSIVVGLRIALAAAWIHLVAGEMMGVRSGLGYLIIDARNMLRTELVVAAMIIIGLLGLFLDQLIRWGERRVSLHWDMTK